MAELPTAAEARSIATQVSIFGYPLVLNELAVRAAERRSPVRADGGTDPHRHDPEHLASYGQFRVRDEPEVLTLPAMQARPWSLQLCDGWGEPFASVAAHPQDMAGSALALCPSPWSGELPPGLKPLYAPGDLITVQVSMGWSPASATSVRRLQDAFRLTRLSTLSQGSGDPLPWQHPDAMAQAELDLAALSSVEFLALLTAAMGRNPPRKADTYLLGQAGRLGIVPGRSFNVHELTPEVRDGLAGATASAASIIFSNVDALEEGSSSGPFGTHYLQRATAAMFNRTIFHPVPTNRRDVSWPTAQNRISWSSGAMTSASRT